MDLFTADNLIHTLLGALAGLITWLGRNALKRVERLELTSMSKEDTKARYEENVQTLKRIEMLIERNHRDSVDGRHRTANQILTLTAQVAKLEGRIESSQEGRE